LHSSKSLSDSITALLLGTRQSILSVTPGQQRAPASMQIQGCPSSNSVAGGSRWFPCPINYPIQVHLSEQFWLNSISIPKMVGYVY
jgi:hypothetical protein